MPEDESGEFAGCYWRSQAKIDEDLPRLTSSSIDDVTFRHLADHIPTLCWVANGDGFIVWYNRRWHEYCGTKAQDMEGWGWMAVHDPDSLPVVLERWTSALSEGQPFEMTFPLKGADGRFRPFLTRIQPVRDASGEIVRWFGVNTEISAQVAAEDALRIERDRSRGILENISDGFLVLDDAFVIRQISAEGLRIDGRAASDIIGRSHWDVYPGTEAGELGHLYKSALAEGTPVALDHQYVWPDGHRTWFEMRAYPTPDRKFLGIFYRDVTERINAELALRASEEQFRIFAQSVPNHVWSAWPDGSLYWFNKPVYAYTGLIGRQLEGAGWTQIVHPDDIEAAGNAWSHALRSGEVYETEFRIRRADGEYRWFLVRAEPVRGAEGAIGRWVGTNTDIHDHKATQAELANLNATLEQQVEERTRESDRAWRLAQELLVVALPDGTIKAINPTWTPLLGWDAHEIVGSKFEDLAHPEDLEAARTAFVGIFEKPTIVPFEYRLRHKEGSYRWFAWTGSFEDGRVYAAGRDLTLEREQAEALRQSQKMEAIGQLTGGVAHDFNNLLTIIRSSVDLLRRPGQTPERRQRYLDAVSDTVDRAAKLTGQLLAFGRRQALRPEVFEVSEKLDGVCDMLNTITGSHVRVVTCLAKTACHVRADVSQFETALVNLAVNARDAMGGEGTLTLALNVGCTLPGIRGNGPSARLYVAVAVGDTGTGIAPDQLGRIFEPFFTTKEIGKGTGLGLSQVFGFAKQSGGDIDVVSEVGRGTTFKLYLPQVEAPSAQEWPNPEPDISPFGVGERILVVEDNLDVGRFCTQILEDLGYATDWAIDAEEALRRIGLDGGGYRAVFSDVVMPGMDGIELARRLRARLPEMPVILASGYSHVLAHEDDHGFEVVHKPYSADQIGRVLRRIIGEPPVRGRQHIDAIPGLPDPPSGNRAAAGGTEALAGRGSPCLGSGDHGIAGSTEKRR